MSGSRRIIVGTSGAPGSLPALRYAAELARQDDATLIPVLAWLPPGGDVADRRCPSSYLRQIWKDVDVAKLVLRRRSQERQRLDVRSRARVAHDR